MSNKLEETIKNGVDKGLSYYLCKLAFIYLILLFIQHLFNMFTIDHDDTDPIDGSSGLKVFIDNRTNCQYISADNSGITPRLNADGKQICN